MNVAIKEYRRIVENERIADMERRITPLLYCVLIAVAGVIAGILIDAYAAQKYAGHTSTSQAFAQCLNGKTLNVDGSIVRCEIKQYALVKGLK